MPNGLGKIDPAAIGVSEEESGARIQAARAAEAIVDRRGRDRRGRRVLSDAAVAARAQQRFGEAALRIREIDRRPRQDDEGDHAGDAARRTEHASV